MSYRNDDNEFLEDDGYDGEAMFRSPDKPRRERLVPSAEAEEEDVWESKYTSDLETALQLSVEQHDASMIAATDLEEAKAISVSLSEARKNTFPKIKAQLNKLMGFELTAHTLYWYQTVLNIVEMYENAFIEVYEMSEQEYMDLLNCLKMVRLPETELSLLKEIIVFM